MTPYRRLQGIATGVIGWTADQFWRSTPHELFDAIEGFNRANGADSEEDDRDPAFEAWRDREIARERTIH